MAINSIPSQDKDLQVDSRQNVINSYLRQNSEVFQALDELKREGWEKAEGDKYFQAQRSRADKASHKAQRQFLNMMMNIGNEMERKTQSLKMEIPAPQILDLCMAPGGFSAAALEQNPDAHICGIALPQGVGGHRVLVRNKNTKPPDDRVEIWYEDITMLVKDFDAMSFLEANPDHPENNFITYQSPYANRKFDLVFCDGHILRTHAPHRKQYREDCEASRLTCSQLIYALGHINTGGTLIILLHKPERWNVFQLLYMLGKFSDIQLFKPSTAHKSRSSFYVVAKHMRPDCEEAKAALKFWREKWIYMTFTSVTKDPCTVKEAETTDKDSCKDACPLKDAQSLSYDERRVQNVAELDKMLETWGPDFIKMAEPVWSIQLEALQNAQWMRNGEL